MIKKLSRVVLTALLTMALLAVPLTAVYAQDTSSPDTRARGYQLINGDVYDLHGNLLIKMHNGYTPDGYTLDPNFTVFDPSIDAPSNATTVSPETTITIYDGSPTLNKNVTGNEGIQLDGEFTVSSSVPNVRGIYQGGVPSAINIAIDNITRGTQAAYFPSIKPGTSNAQYKLIYNGSPTDKYIIKASAVDVAGRAHVTVENY